jgi:type IV fimbrial biogenesis protein FimT
MMTAIPSSPLRCIAPSSNQSGMTLIELMVTVAIVAIVMGLGVPSYRYVTNANRIAAEVNALLGDMQLARAEAVKEGQTVTVCSSTDGASCSGNISWKTGWIVFSDPNGNQTVDSGETVVRVQGKFHGGDSFNADNGVSAVTFNREGFAIGTPSPTTITLHDSTGNAKWTRCLAIKTVGMVSTQSAGTGNCT